MFRLLIVLSFILSQEPQTRQQYFAAIFSTGSAWDTTKTFPSQRHAKLHSQNLKRLRDEGRLAIGGRYGEYGFILVKARDLSEAKSFFAGDSSVIENIFRLEIHPFNPFYKGSIE